jgi:hypothetical protein
MGGKSSHVDESELVVMVCTMVLPALQMIGHRLYVGVNDTYAFVVVTVCARTHDESSENERMANSHMFGKRKYYILVLFLLGYQNNKIK